MTTWGGFRVKPLKAQVALPIGATRQPGVLDLPVPGPEIEGIGLGLHRLLPWTGVGCGVILRDGAPGFFGGRNLGLFAEKMGGNWEGRGRITAGIEAGFGWRNGATLRSTGRVVSVFATMA